MPKFSETSRKKLSECHPDLRRVFERVVLQFDCIVLDGERTIEEQEENVRKGVSKTLNSKHLRQSDGLSHAVDVAPYPLDWADRERMYYFAGYVKGVAENLGVVLRYGGDWDGDTEVKDQTFFDLVHWELVHGR